MTGTARSFRRGGRSVTRGGAGAPWRGRGSARVEGGGRRFAGALVLACAVASCSVPASAPERPRVVRIQARKFAFSPSAVHVRKGVPVTLELESLDRVHGFEIPDLGKRADVVPGRLARLDVTSKESGSLRFRCDVFCGEGHEDMVGTIVVDP